MPQLQVKDAGVWKQAQGVYVKEAGVWKVVTQGWVKEAGVWKQFYPDFTPGVNNVIYPTAGTFSYTIPAGVFSITVSGIGGGGHTCGYHDGGYCQYSDPQGPGSIVRNVTIPVTPGKVCNFTVGYGGGAGSYNGNCGRWGQATSFSYDGSPVFVAQPGGVTGGTIYMGTGGSIVNGGAGGRVSGCDGTVWNTYDVLAYAQYSGDYSKLGNYSTIIDPTHPYNGLTRIQGLVKITY